MKRCNVCFTEKPSSDFNSNGYTPRSTKKLKAMCKPCESSGKKVKSKTMLSDMVVMKCTECGYDKCVSAIEFHHIDPSTKLFNIGPQRIADVEKIKNEIRKCAILCSNCHREAHAGVFKISEKHRAVLLTE